MTYSRPKGTSDIYGNEAAAWRSVEKTIHSVCRDFRFEEIRTPMYEHTEVFTRGVGETTDIVQKEMFTFQDAGGRSLTLRPEGTAGVARAFVENSMFGGVMPVKLYYIMPNFRAEKPQKGRSRQHTQFGVEFFGAETAECEAEVISVAYEVIRRLGIRGVELRINSIGCAECREKYNSVLKQFLGGKINELCAECAKRFQKNPLRALDCKNENCKKIMASAPSPLSVLDEECAGHFEKVKDCLNNLGISYIVDEKLVRGLDYYTRTVFEFISSDLGAQSSLGGGGRYDGLIEALQGPETPAVGFGMGIERLLIVLESQGLLPNTEPQTTVFAGHMGEAGKALACSMIHKLRQNGISAEGDILGRSVKAQMKFADKLGAKYSLIIGDDEVKTGIFKIKDMKTGAVTEIAANGIIEFFTGKPEGK